MMKKLGYIALITGLIACGGENANDCFQVSGNVVQQQVEVTPFDRILVNEGIEMTIQEGIDYEVIITAGENLLNDVRVEVVDNQLVLSNNNTCNFFRSYAPVKMHVTAPNITEIRSSTQFDIHSEGILTYPQLSILSEDYSGNYLNSGNFYLTINNTSFTLTFNNLSNCFISGETESLTVGFYGGNSRFEGATLLAKQVNVFHRSANDIIVYPVESLQGNIYSTGNVIAVNIPPVVNVTEHYKGKLIFQN